MARGEGTAAAPWGKNKLPGDKYDGVKDAEFILEKIMLRTRYTSATRDAIAEVIIRAINKHGKKGASNNVNRSSRTT